MRTALIALLAATAMALTACGGSSGGDEGAVPATTPAAPPTTASTPGDATAGGAEAPSETNAATGEQLVSTQNCLACHRIGSGGAPGPGPELSDIGDELSSDQIADTLRQGPGSMPSYQGLENNRPEDFERLVAYLAGLRG